jgi:hypothetical protein
MELVDMFLNALSRPSDVTVKSDEIVTLSATEMPLYYDSLEYCILGWVMQLVEEQPSSVLGFGKVQGDFAGFQQIWPNVVVTTLYDMVQFRRKCIWNFWNTVSELPKQT